MGEELRLKYIFEVLEGGWYKGGTLGDKVIQPDYHPFYDPENGMVVCVFKH